MKYIRKHQIIFINKNKMSTFDFDSIDNALVDSKENSLFSLEETNVEYLPTDTCTAFTDSVQVPEDLYEHFEETSQIVFENSEMVYASNNEQ